MKIEDFMKVHLVAPGTKLKVDEVFATRGVGVPVDHFGTFENAKNYFDKPDDLAYQPITPGPFSKKGGLIIHRRDIKYIQHRMEVTNQVAAEFGAPQSMDDVMRMKKEVDRRIAELN